MLSPSLRCEFQVNYRKFTHHKIYDATCTEKRHLRINDVALWHLSWRINSRISQLDSWWYESSWTHKAASCAPVSWHGHLVANQNIVHCRSRYISICYLMTYTNVSGVPSSEIPLGFHIYSEFRLLHPLRAIALSRSGCI